MKFGICGSVDLIEEALAAGFDYVEPGAHMFRALDEDAPQVASRVEVTNLFFQGGVDLYGETPNYLAYGRRLFPRAQAAGITTMVVGSGAVRNAPSGVPPLEAEMRFVQIVGELQTIANEFNIKLCPESLNKSETNVGNDLPRLAVELREVGVAYCADSYHIFLEMDPSEPVDAYLERAIPWAPIHVHFAGLERYSPDQAEPLTQAFARRLREVGYDGKVSFEGNRQDDPLPVLLEKMRACFP